ncbi:MAG: hypothetical protein K9H49_09150 [Bacteroidales bacterium]|nr:hypothetical protein [Bacteroidales bacterium]MCF8391834.1 hypothetical protein [Bacteroidales bacterium]
MHNEDEMANGKVSDGIRRFNADMNELKKLISELI